MEQWPKPEAAAAATMRQRLAVLREVGGGSQFQLFRDGQGDTVATLTAKTVPLASNPFPWWEKLPLDVSLSVRFTAAERWEKGLRSPGAN